MDIIELNEKSVRMKNKKFSFDFNKEELQLLVDIMKSNIKELQNSIKNEVQEIKIVYCKDSFDKLSHYNELLKNIKESMLRSAILELTYDQMDILWDCIIHAEVDMKHIINKYSRTFMPEVCLNHDVICNMIKRYEKEADKAINKLYPKRASVISKMEDYINESSYNGFLIDCSELVTVHISMVEKNDILQKIDNFFYLIETKKISSIIVEKNELPIEVSVIDIKNVCEKITSIITKNVYSGSVFSLLIKEYYVLKYLIDYKID